MKRRNIITNNKEIYEKFNQLSFSSEVILNNVKLLQVEKILNNINRYERVLDMEEFKDRIIIKKLGHVNFNIYLR
jgi:hypothetical protein